MRGIAQNNPILYIFVGCIDQDISLAVQNIQAERIGVGGVGYIRIHKGTQTEDVLKEMEACHKQFITKKYRQASEIKVNYVLDADDSFSLEMPRIKREMESYLQYLYPASVATDIYAVMNDATAVFSDEKAYRGDVLTMLEKIQNEACLVYILSNVNSKCLYEPDNKDNIIYSIALMALLKDCVSLKPAYIVENLYSERYFKEDCAKYGGKFMSIGYANIKKPLQIIQKLFIAKLLTFMEDERVDFSINIILPKQKFDRYLFSDSNLAGLGLSGRLTKGEKESLTNQQAVNKIFGDRLDLFYDLNHVERDSAPIEIPIDFSAGFYAVYYMTAPNGSIIAKLKELLRENNEAAYEREYDEWLNRKGPTTSWKQLFNPIDEYPLALARMYLECKHMRMQAAKERKLIEAAIHQVNEIHNRCHRRKTELDLYISECSESVDTFGINRMFYESWLDQYLDEHMDEFHSIYQQMYDLESGSYINLLQDYVKSKLLKQFSGSLISKEFLMNWVNENEVYNVYLKTGKKNLHSETNILIDRNNPLLLDKEKVNLFFDHNENQIDILYHLGGFSKEDFYYAELYHRKVQHSRVAGQES